LSSSLSFYARRRYVRRRWSRVGGNPGETLSFFRGLQRWGSIIWEPSLTGLIHIHQSREERHQLRLYYPRASVMVVSQGSTHLIGGVCDGGGRSICRVGLEAVSGVLVNRIEPGLRESAPSVGSSPEIPYWHVIQMRKPTWGQ
jgi:hypothetical protein